ncbi:Cytochrome c oxidase subunit 6 [Coniosporium apollinis]|uniref:Cytochrome c oxidase subunit 6, mitochondrial n=2 Tax=Coniosporium TaxID=2810619 RepID=A0ABQ9NRA0_9PEZI|nr:Cytochrome c oxidase subunit 6 [Cladosporium sp. JES 115]KAJ9664440.1 Cytochrome c oxidase subunit 6 [Coniosporium apollinis]
MLSSSILRAAVRTSRPALYRPALAARCVAPVSRSAFSTTARRADEHAEESFEEFTARYEKEFEAVQDVFELQRNLNNAFAYDLVPSPSVIVAALKAARRVNDYPTAVRIFEGAYPGPTQLQDTSADSSIKSAKMWDNQKADARSLSTGIKAKVENKGQYDEYLKELEPLREELGINLKESMYPDPTR